LREGHFKKNVIRVLKERAGGLCSNPSCRRPTIGPLKASNNKSTTIGEAAHIKGAAPNSARYDAGQTEEERHSITNGVWLCRNCAGLIDKDSGADFSVQKLISWKKAAERAAHERLVRHSQTVKENCLHTLIYINVPRLVQYSRLTSDDIEVPDRFSNGIPDQGMIVRELVQLEKSLESIDFPALPWKEAVDEFDDPTGMVVSFEGRFWTKNGPRERNYEIPPDFSKLTEAPHIYAKYKGKKFVLVYDPKFVTTNTAIAELSSGQLRVGGFAIVKKANQHEIWASPLFFGLWSSPEAQDLMDALSFKR